MLGPECKPGLLGARQVTQEETCMGPSCEATQMIRSVAYSTRVFAYRSSCFHPGQLLVSGNISPVHPDISTFLEKKETRILVLIVWGFNMRNVFYFSNIVRPILYQNKQNVAEFWTWPAVTSLFLLHHSILPPPGTVFASSRTWPHSYTGGSQEPDLVDEWEIWCLEINLSLIFEMMELVTPKVSFAWLQINI